MAKNRSESLYRQVQKMLTLNDTWWLSVSSCTALNHSLSLYIYLKVCLRVSLQVQGQINSESMVGIEKDDILLREYKFN